MSYLTELKDRQESVEVRCYDGKIIVPKKAFFANPHVSYMCASAQTSVRVEMFKSDFETLFKGKVEEEIVEELIEEVIEEEVKPSLKDLQTLYKKTLWTSALAKKTTKMTYKEARASVFRELCKYSKQRELYQFSFDVKEFHKLIKHGCSHSTLLKAVAPLTDELLQELVEFVVSLISEVKKS